MSELKHPLWYHGNFAASPYGKKLEESVRFGDFKPDTTDNALWEKLLGDDVNNLHHMPHTHSIAMKFCQWEGMGGRVLGLTAISHDWGEAIHGDTAHPDKTEEGELDGIRALERIDGELHGNTDLSEVVGPVLSGEDKFFADRFRAIEYIGYSLTALRAWRVGELVSNNLLQTGLSRKHKEHLVGGLLSLYKAVAVNNLRTLAEYAEKYPAVERVMNHG